MTDAKTIEDLNSFLDDSKISKKLILTSIHISLFELINYQVVNALKYFFSNDIRLINGKLVTCDETQEYIDNVKRHFKKDLYKSSAYWYMTNDIIEKDDFDLLVKFRDDRNDAAHEIINILFDSNFSIVHADFKKVVDIYKKICLWWIREVESTTNPAFDNINRDTFDFEKAIEPQLFPANRLLDLLKNIDN
ncbi:MAG: hypothetical protein K1X81_06630 [Bacteroidia bacterium]|nr:hypothetical protein [Bacteroidia bacterium]